MRAKTPEQKREVVERLLAAWFQVPELRLGQFFVVCLGASSIFYVEDGDLADRAEAAVERMLK